MTSIGCWRKIMRNKAKCPALAAVTRLSKPEPRPEKVLKVSCCSDV
jgi:hypothetical protein